MEMDSAMERWEGGGMDSATKRWEGYSKCFLFKVIEDDA